MANYTAIPDFVFEQLFSSIKANQLNQSIKALFEDVFQNPTGNFISTIRMNNNANIYFNQDASGTERLFNDTNNSNLAIVDLDYEPVSADFGTFKILGDRVFLMARMNATNVNPGFWPIQGILPAVNLGIPLPEKCSLTRWSHSFQCTSFTAAGSVRVSAFNNEVLLFSLTDKPCSGLGPFAQEFTAFNRAVQNWALDQRFSLGVTVPTGTLSVTTNNLIEFSTEP